MKDKRALKEASMISGDKILMSEAKRLGKEIKKNIKKGEKSYYSKNFNENFDIKTAWRTAN